MRGKNTSAIDKREVRQIRKDLESLGFSTRRQPGSGNRAVDLQHDVFWRDSPIGPLHIEDKYREECRWKVFLGWMAGADFLTVRNARDERYLFTKWQTFLDFMKAYQALAEENERLVGLANGDRDIDRPRPAAKHADSAGDFIVPFDAKIDVAGPMYTGGIARYNAPQSLLTGEPKPKSKPNKWPRRKK